MVGLPSIGPLELMATLVIVVAVVWLVLRRLGIPMAPRQVDVPSALRSIRGRVIQDRPRVCPVCGTVVLEGAPVCPECGFDL